MNKQCPSCGGDCGYTKTKGCQYRSAPYAHPDPDTLALLNNQAARIRDYQDACLQRDEIIRGYREDIVNQTTQCDHWQSKWADTHMKCTAQQATIAAQAERVEQAERYAKTLKGCAEADQRIINDQAAELEQCKLLDEQRVARIDSQLREIDALTRQLTESQALVAMLREVLQFVVDMPRAAEGIRRATQALALPSDDSALRARLREEWSEVAKWCEDSVFADAIEAERDRRFEEGK